MIRVGWHDVVWRPALEAADLYVEPLPRILCTDSKVSSTGRKSKVRRPKKNAFMYLIVHQTKGEYYWEPKDRNSSFLENNPYAMDCMMIGGITPIYNRNKLCEVGNPAKILRPQENSLYEVRAYYH